MGPTNFLTEKFITVALIYERDIPGEYRGVYSPEFVIQKLYFSIRCVLSRVCDLILLLVKVYYVTG